MFKKNDPLVDAVAKVMQENQIRREVERQVNETYGIHSKKVLPFEHHAEYDRVLAEKTQEALSEGWSMKKEELKGNQSKIDANHNGKIDGQDFKLLRAKKKGQMEEDASSDPDFAAPRPDNTKKAGDIVFKSTSDSSDRGSAVTKEPPMPPKKPDSLKEAKYSAKAARAGEDIGKPGKNFEKIAKKAGEKYGSEERGKKVAGAILAKIRAKHMKEEEQLDETSGNKIMAYTKSATVDQKNAESSYKNDEREARKVGTSIEKSAHPDYQRAQRRAKGLAMVKKKMGMSEESLDEKAPSGDKFERMVKHIKKGYSKDGKLTDKEKSIAYATAWKAKNKEDK